MWRYRKGLSKRRDNRVRIGDAVFDHERFEIKAQLHGAAQFQALPIPAPRELQAAALGPTQ